MVKMGTEKEWNLEVNSQLTTLATGIRALVDSDMEIRKHIDVIILRVMELESRTSCKCRSNDSG